MSWLGILLIGFAVTDLTHASADYRRNLTRVLTERALRKAIARAT